MTDPEIPDPDALEKEHPKGTLVFLLGFIGVIVFMWLITYYLLIERS